MKAILVELTPYDAENDERVTLYLTNINDSRVTLVEGGPGEFLPVLCGGPIIARSLFNGDFTGGGSAPQSELMVRIDEGTQHEWMTYVWGDADVAILQGNVGDAYGDFELMWSLRASTIEREGVLTRVVIQPPETLNRPMLYLSFSGTDDGDSGDSGEGRIELRGTLKPWLSGTARFLRPVLIDPARQIYCYHGYGPTGGVTDCFEGGVNKGAPTYEWADYDTMRDQVMTSAQWGHCPSLGLLRLGGEPSFPVTIHASGDKPDGTVLTKTGDIVKRILEGPGAIDVPAVPATTLALINSIRPEAIDFYLTSQRTVQQAITELMLAANGYWIENEQAQIILGILPPNLQGFIKGWNETTDNLLSEAEQDIAAWTMTGATPEVYRSFVKLLDTSGANTGRGSETFTTVATQEYSFSVRAEMLQMRSGGPPSCKVELTNGASTYVVLLNPRTGAYTVSGIAESEVTVKNAGDSWLVTFAFTAEGTTITVDLYPDFPGAP